MRIVNAVLAAMLLFLRVIDGMRSIDDDYAGGERPRRPSSFRSGKIKTSFTEAEAGHISRQLAACEYGKKREGRLRGQVAVMQMTLSNQTVQCVARVKGLEQELLQKEEAWSSAFAQRCRSATPLAQSSRSSSGSGGSEGEEKDATILRLEGRIAALEEALEQKEAARMLAVAELEKLKSAPPVPTESEASVPGPDNATIPIPIPQNGTQGVEERKRSRVEARKKLRRGQSPQAAAAAAAAAAVSAAEST